MNFRWERKNRWPKWEKNCWPIWEKDPDQVKIYFWEKSFLLRGARFKPAEMKTWRCKWRKGEALRAVGNEGIQEWAKLLKYTGRFLMPWKWRLLNWTSNKVPVKICQQSILRNHDCWSILASHLSANFFPIHGRFFLFSPKVLKWWRGEKSLQNYGLVMMQPSPWRMKNSCTALIFSISRGLRRSREWWLFLDDMICKQLSSISISYLPIRSMMLQIEDKIKIRQDWWRQRTNWKIFNYRRSIF